MYALDSASPVRDAVVEAGLWTRVATMEPWGLNRVEIQEELEQLADAAYHVLERTGRHRDEVSAFHDIISGKLAALLDWP